MLVNWFTVAAQALNFVVLVWLMKRFLYRPVLDAIDAREKGIAAKLAGADAKKAEAERVLDAAQTQTAAFDQAREARFEQMTGEVEHERKRLLAEARKAAEVDGRKYREALFKDTQALDRSIGLRVQEEVFNIARKTLRDLAGASLEDRMADAFLKRLKAMDDPTKAALCKGLGSASLPATARSAFDLSDGQRESIQRTLDETLSRSVPLRFETDPSLICGIVLAMNGQKVSWSISDSIAALEKGVAERLKTDAKGPELPGTRDGALARSP